MQDSIDSELRVFLVLTIIRLKVTSSVLYSIQYGYGVDYRNC